MKGRFSPPLAPLPFLHHLSPHLDAKAPSLPQLNPCHFSSLCLRVTHAHWCPQKVEVGHKCLASPPTVCVLGFPGSPLQGVQPSDLSLRGLPLLNKVGVSWLVRLNLWVHPQGSLSSPQGTAGSAGQDEVGTSCGGGQQAAPLKEGPE